MFDCICLLRRERPHAPKRCRKLRTPQLVHLLAKLSHDRYRCEACDPVPVFLDLFSDDFARGWHVFAALLEIGGRRGAKIIQIVEKHVPDVSDCGLDIARKRNVEYAKGPVAASLDGFANAIHSHYWNWRCGRADEDV